MNSLDKTVRYFWWFSNFPQGKNLFQSGNVLCPTIISNTADEHKIAEILNKFLANIALNIKIINFTIEAFHNSNHLSSDMMTDKCKKYHRVVAIKRFSKDYFLIHFQLVGRGDILNEIRSNAPKPGLGSIIPT